MTLSFNLLQRAWPVEHTSWGWEQTLGYWSPDGHNYFLHSFTTVTLLDLLCFHIVPWGSWKSWSKRGQIGQGRVLRGDIEKTIAMKYFKSETDFSLNSEEQRPLQCVVKGIWHNVSEVGTGGGGWGAGEHTSPHLADEIKGHFEKLKINVSYQFQLLKNVTGFSLTHFN